MADLQRSSAGDGAPPQPSSRNSRNSRREFFKIAGGTGAAAALLLAGCDTAGPGLGPDPSGGSGGGINQDADVVFDFSTDFGVLNYAYALEQLEAAFYITACNNAYDGITDIEEYYLSALRGHEKAHRDFLNAALGANAIDPLEVDFSSVDFGSRNAVLTLSQVLEDTGVSAYNGAANFLTNPAFLTLAGKIVSVEARHAAVIRATLSGDPTFFADLTTLVDYGAVPENGLDAAQSPELVVAAVNATGLVVPTLGVMNT